jgi:pSer/pThr/pTyr-binding forkhead associated (FHA) protein
LTLNDPKVSRRHATVTRSSAGRLDLRDDDSLNGTWLNGRRIDAVTALSVGDRVRIGSSEFIVFADEEPWANDMLTERDLEQLLGASDGDRTLVVTGETT